MPPVERNLRTMLSEVDLPTQQVKMPTTERSSSPIKKDPLPTFQLPVEAIDFHFSRRTIERLEDALQERIARESDWVEESQFFLDGVSKSAFVSWRLHGLIGNLRQRMKLAGLRSRRGGAPKPLPLIQNTEFAAAIVPDVAECLSIAAQSPRTSAALSLIAHDLLAYLHEHRPEMKRRFGLNISDRDATCVA